MFFLCGGACKSKGSLSSHPFPSTLHGIAGVGDSFPEWVSGKESVIAHQDNHLLEVAGSEVHVMGNLQAVSFCWC